MKTLTKKEYQQKLKKIKEKNIQKEYRRNLRREKYKGFKINVETSKFLAIYLFLLLNSIIVYAMVAMWKFYDLSYLGVLITDIAAQVLIYGIYCLKAYKAKKAEEDMRYKRDCRQDNLKELLAAGANCGEIVPT